MQHDDRTPCFVCERDAGTDLEGKSFADVEGIQRDSEAADFGVVSDGGCCASDQKASASADSSASVCCS